MAEKNFDAFKETIEQKFMRHPVVTDNAYTAWFARGAMTLDELDREYTPLREQASAVRSYL